MRSFSARITVQFAVVITVTAGAVLGVGRWLLWREAVKGLDLLNHAEFIEIRDRLGPHPEVLTPAEVDRRIRPHTEVDSALYFFQVRNGSDAIIFRSGNLSRAKLPDLTGGPPRATAAVASLGTVRVCDFRYGPLQVEVASPWGPVERLLREYARVSLVLLGSVALASVAMGWGFARLTLQPVRAIHGTAARIRADNLGERIPVPAGRDELAALVRLLNLTFDRLEGSFDQVKRFTADASHELKTPLTVVRLHAEKLRPRLAADPEGTGELEDLLEELGRIRRIIDSLLFLAKAESGSMAIAMADVPAEALVRSFAEDADVMADDCGARFAVARADAGSVRCEPTLLRQLLLNLATNAFRVSPPNGQVTVESILQSDLWRLVVEDRGPGLSADRLERIFERFVRFVPTREGGARIDEGDGLGLAICRTIASLHSGKIWAENRSDGTGLRVIVDLPR